MREKIAYNTKYGNNFKFISLKYSFYNNQYRYNLFVTESSYIEVQNT